VVSDAGGAGSAIDVAQSAEPPPVDPATIEPPEAPRPGEAGAVPTGTRAELIARDGKLPGTQAKADGVRTMPASEDPNATALAYTQKTYNGQTPSPITALETGGFVAKMPDGAFVTFRPAGQAGPKTLDTTASVDINDPAINRLNGGQPLKLKFPRK